MNTYRVEIREVLKKVITVSAGSEGEAIEKVEAEYNTCGIVLDDRAFRGVEFDIV